jgi:hypothetical protein
MTPTITAEVEGVPIIGRILGRTASTLEVELLHPFGRLTDSRSIMALAQRYVTYEGLHGGESARAILTNLYRASAFVHAHLDELRSRWAETRKQLDERCNLIVKSRAEFVEERAKSRRMLREGVTSSDDHQRWMITLSNDFEEWTLLVADAVDALFAECGIDLSYDVQAQLMRRVDPTFDMPHEVEHEE